MVPVADPDGDTTMEAISPKNQLSFRAPTLERIDSLASMESRVDPDAQTTVTDFLDFTDYLPSDVVRSLILIGKLDERYANASLKVNDLTTLWGRLPTISAEERPTPLQLRADISEQLDQAVNSRTFAHAEAIRMSDNINRHYNKAKVLLSKLKKMRENYPTEEPKSPVQTRSPQAARSKALKAGGDGGQKPRRPQGPRIIVPGEVQAPYDIDQDTFTDESDVSSDDDSDTPAPNRRTPGPRIKLVSNKPPKTPSRLARPVTYATPALSEAAAANNAALLQPPPDDAVVGSPDAPWLQLTHYELAKLRKRMKKNATWTPSETMIARELKALGRGPDAYHEAKKDAKEKGERFEPVVPQAIVDTKSGEKQLPAGALSPDTLSAEEVATSNRGMKLNEAKKLKREALAKMAAEEAEESARKMNEAAKLFLGNGNGNGNSNGNSNGSGNSNTNNANTSNANANNANANNANANNANAGNNSNSNTNNNGSNGTPKTPTSETPIKETPKPNKTRAASRSTKRKREPEPEEPTNVNGSAEKNESRPQVKRTKTETPVPPPPQLTLSKGPSPENPAPASAAAPGDHPVVSHAETPVPIPIPAMATRASAKSPTPNPAAASNTGPTKPPPHETPVPLPFSERRKSVTPVLPPVRENTKRETRGDAAKRTQQAQQQQTEPPQVIQPIPEVSEEETLKSEPKTSPLLQTATVQIALAPPQSPPPPPPPQAPEPAIKQTSSRAPTPRITPGPEGLAIRRPSSRGKAASQEPQLSLAADRPRRASTARNTPAPEPRPPKRTKRPAPGIVSTTKSGGNSAVGKRKAPPKKKARPKKDRGSAEVELEDVDDDGNPIDPDEARYCLCNRVSFGTMIACENSEVCGSLLRQKQVDKKLTNGQCKQEWFHLECVDLTEVPARTTKWYCPECRVKLNIGEKGEVSARGIKK